MILCCGVLTAPYGVTSLGGSRRAMILGILFKIAIPIGIVMINTNITYAAATAKLPSHQPINTNHSTCTKQPGPCLTAITGWLLFVALISFQLPFPDPSI